MSRVRVPGDVLVWLRRARDHADRRFAEPLVLDDLAAVAGLSKHHFHRLFSATYGITPAAYVSERRVERAQDLLRTTNLTITEVCHGVGSSSLGSFSSRFRDLVGETPSAFQARYAVAGAPLSDDLVAAMRRAQDEGGMPGVGLHVDDCRATVADLKAKGVEFLQDPEERPYGVEALMRDNSGNWMVLVEPREYRPEDIDPSPFVD